MLDFVDDTNSTIVLHVDARYNWNGNVNVLVLNTFQGRNWHEEEVRPDGFDFTHGIGVKLRVKTEEEGFAYFRMLTRLHF